MKNQFFLSFLIVSLTLFSACGGSSSGGSSSKLYPGTITDGGSEVGGVVTDDDGNSAVGIERTAGSGTLGTTLLKLSDGTMVNIAVGDGTVAGQKEGYPVTVTSDGNTIAFSNWTSTTFDFTATDADGNTETQTDVDYSEYAAMSLGTVENLHMSAVTKATNWGGFFSALYTTIKLGSCPVSAILSAGTMGASFGFTVVTCTLAGRTLWQMMSDQPTLIESAVNTVTGAGSCAAVQSTGGTATSQEACVVNSAATAKAGGTYVDENGNIGTDDSGGGGSSTFAGSCTVSGACSYCVNYTGSAYTTAGAQQACDGMYGTYSESSCSHDNSLGYCTVGSGTSSIYYIIYYDTGWVASELEGICTDNYGGIWTGLSQ